MLIKFSEIISNIQNIKINGVLHVGAHDCEELSLYNDYLNLNNSNIIWIDAMETKVEENIKKGIQNVFHAVITDKDDENITFNIASNVQSSSILKPKTHLKEHPHIKFNETKIMKSMTIDTFFEKKQLNPKNYNFWNLDIQGAELLAMIGGQKSLHFVDVIYVEVNEKELYENCGKINEIDDLLKKYNFKRTLTNMTNYGWGDSLYVKHF